MKINPTHFLTRCTLWMGALFTATSLFAGPVEDVAAADAALALGDLPTGMSLLRKAADQNHSGAQARLGDLLRASQYEVEAVAMYKKSAAQGDPAGEYGLGRAYADGAGVKADAALAVEFYRKAEQKNHPQAIDALGRAYLTGTLGLPKDPVKAREYEERAAALRQTATAKGAAR